jgi:hypothetical protein
MGISGILLIFIFIGIGSWVVDLQTSHVQSGMQTATANLVGGIKDGSGRIGAGIENGLIGAGIGTGLCAIGVGLGIGLVVIGIGIGCSHSRQAPLSIRE